MTDLLDASVPVSTILLCQLIYWAAGTIVSLLVLDYFEVVDCSEFLTGRKAAVKKWPPISDNQFVKLCKPRTSLWDAL